MGDWRLLGGVLLCCIVAGCLGGSDPEEPHVTSQEPFPTVVPTMESPPAANASQPEENQAGMPGPLAAPALTSVVVADLSAGTNPYHVAHRRPGWTQPPWLTIPSMPHDLPSLNLTFLDDPKAALEADRAVWQRYQTGVVHWVPETNLLLLTLEAYPEQPAGYNVASNHGLQTADAVSTACPSCYVLIIQDWNNLDGGAMKYIADNLPWVDLVVSSNYAFNNVEYVDAVVSEAYAKETRRLWDRGSLVFQPSGNGVVTPNAQVGVTYSLHFANFPPWVVMVGGSEPLCRGVAADASRPTEFVSDFTQILAMQGNSTAKAMTSGTSYSAPRAAGLFAQTLVALRQVLPAPPSEGALWQGPPLPGSWLGDGVLTNEELRKVMAESAIHYATSDFVAPPNCELNPPNRYPTSPAIPVTPTPWMDMGWGHLGLEQSDQALLLLLSGEEIERNDATMAWMEAFAQTRGAVFPW